MLATRPRTSLTVSASVSSPADCRRSTTAPGSSSRDAERAALEAEGRKPHWRFRLANSEDGLTPLPTIVSWNDLIRGDQTVDVGSLSDPVVIRADGSFLYTFTSVVDDAEFGITHVIRGEDHVTNTRRAVAAVRSAGARSAGLRPSQPAHRRRRSGAVEAARRAVDREPARERPRAVGARQLHGADRHLRRHRAAGEPRRSGATLRLRQDLYRAGALRSR